MCVGKFDMTKKLKVQKKKLKSKQDLTISITIDPNEGEDLVRTGLFVREVCDIMTGDREIMIRKIHRCLNSVSHSLTNKARCEAY